MNKALILLIIINSATGEQREVDQSVYETCQETAAAITEFADGYTAACRLDITPSEKDKRSKSVRRQA